MHNKSNQWSLSHKLLRSAVLLQYKVKFTRTAYDVRIGADTRALCAVIEFVEIDAVPTAHGRADPCANNIHRESKKGDAILLSISSLNIDRFS